jgi:hypothetical protein
MSYLADRSSRSIKTGPGSRGGRWHDPEYRREYMRAWRAAHPEYRLRERLRRWRARANSELADSGPSSFPRSLPLPAVFCTCADCGCRTEVVTVCGFCREGLH